MACGLSIAIRSAKQPSCPGGMGLETIPFSILPEKKTRCFSILPVLRNPLFTLQTEMFHYQIIPYTLHFQFDAGTSRGVLREKKTWFIRLWNTEFPQKEGWGECGPLAGLSPENPDDFENELVRFSQFVLPLLKTTPGGWEKLSTRWLDTWDGPWLPSAIFGWETAWLDWVNGGQRLICDPLFCAGQWKVPINGLVWMSTIEAMERQAIEKRNQGFDTIKLKVGALNWNEELAMIERLRQEMPASEITLRLDANGAWKPAEALRKLQQLANLGIHSVEQPIAPGQPEAMAALCQESPVAIALDEELISKPFDHEKFALLEKIQPAYIVVKPTLVGGLGQTHQWIQMAEDLCIDWWITSMLESNIGLNAVSQLAAQYHPVLPQGLGTGQLYSNNIASPLQVTKGQIFYNQAVAWEKGSIF